MAKRFFIKVELNKEAKEIKVFSVESPEDVDSNLDFFYEHVADLVDFARFGVDDYENDVVAIVDDEGLLKSENIVYEIRFGEQTRQLAGTLLIGKTERREDHELHTVGFTGEELLEIYKNKTVEVKAIGMTA